MVEGEGGRGGIVVYQSDFGAAGKNEAHDTRD